MLHSALINVMVKAARRAGRSLKRDLGEIENLQVSLKGPANFVSMADRRAEEMLYFSTAFRNLRFQLRCSARVR
jgi:myo-inositol-1(or 4)-monophosphatase